MVVLYSHFFEAERNNEAIISTSERFFIYDFFLLFDNLHYLWSSSFHFSSSLPNEHHNLQRNKAVRQAVTTKCVHNADTFVPFKGEWGSLVIFIPFQKNMNEDQKCPRVGYLRSLHPHYFHPHLEI
jgi:hypothetical protein